MKKSGAIDGVHSAEFKGYPIKFAIRCKKFCLGSCWETIFSFLCHTHPSSIDLSPDDSFLYKKF